MEQCSKVTVYAWYKKFESQLPKLSLLLALFTKFQMSWIIVSTSAM
jgi:hypothetical protein